MKKFNVFYSFAYTDFFLLFFLFIFSILFLAYIKSKIKLSDNVTFFLFLYHNLIFLIYTIDQIFVGNDSLSYFLNYKGYDQLDLYPGQIFLYKIAGYFGYLNISIHVVNYIFSIISFIPFIFFLKIIEKLKIYDHSKIDYYLVISFLFLPSIHFWISGYSKDTISFVIIFFITYLYLTREDLKLPKTNNVFFVFFIIFLTILLYFVRPHLALLISVCCFAYHLKGVKYSFFNYKFILIILLSIPIVYFFLISVFSSNLSYENISKIINIYRNIITENTGSQISSETNFILKFILYIFAPNIFFINTFNLYNIIVIVENTFLIMFFIKLFEFNFSTIKFLRFNLIMTLLFFFSMTIITSNLGISNRQKWMVFLPLLTVFLYARFYLKNLKSSR